MQSILRVSPPVVDSIRWMYFSDLAPVLAIDRASFDRPWGEDSFLWWQQQNNGIVCVALRGDMRVGYVAYEVVNHQCMNVVRLAVHPAMRRQGIGTALMERVKSRLSMRRHMIQMVVHEDLLGVHLFLKRHNFRATGVLPRHCRATGRDYYHFEMRVKGATHVQRSA